MEERFSLPAPDTEGRLTLEKAICLRKSVRNFHGKGMSLQEFSQLLWAAQGVTHGRRYRTVPSAGATYPLKLYCVTGVSGVEKIPAGIYRYIPDEHAIRLTKSGDHRQSLCAACLNQPFIAKAPATFVIGAEFSRTTAHYGERGYKYVYMEAGHLGQNISLQVISLGLATVMVGAFHDQEVASALGLPPSQEPLYVIPVGYPARES